jgi:hypothetical protein
MAKHVIAGLMGNEDDPTIALAEGEKLTQFTLTVGDKLGNGIGHVLEDLRILGLHPTEVAVDLMVLAAHVYAADTRISRTSEAQDSWTREIRLVVPVTSPSVWYGASVELKRLLDFLTGDRWTVNFRERPTKYSSLVTAPKPDLLTVPFDDVGLFSGGLDSLIGAIDALKAGRQSLLVSHAGEGLVSKSQDQCFEGLKAAFPGQRLERLRLWMNFDSNLVEGAGKENTTRGRSFLFFALGIAAGSGLRRPFKLRVSENGLIALNVPLDPLRLGALSTRTTHPFYMHRWDEVLKVVGIPGELYNPYWDRTKGEMARECTDPALLEQLVPFSMSCSHPAAGRWRDDKVQGHCGYCLPCLIRRAALKGLNDATQYGIPDLKKSTLDTKQAVGQQIRSFQVAAARVARRPALAKILIHKPGPLTEDSAILPKLEAVYIRGLAEIGTLLEGVKTGPL